MIFDKTDLFVILVANRSQVTGAVLANVFEILHLPVVIFANSLHLHSTILTDPFALKKIVNNKRSKQSPTLAILKISLPAERSFL